MSRVNVGQRVRFDALAACKNSIEKVMADTIGTVVYINERHNWFSVQYGDLRTSFKFCDIGDSVHICNR